MGNNPDLIDKLLARHGQGRNGLLTHVTNALLGRAMNSIAKGCLACLLALSCAAAVQEPTTLDDKPGTPAGE